MAIIRPKRSETFGQSDVLEISHDCPAKMKIHWPHHFAVLMISTVLALALAAAKMIPLSNAEEGRWISTVKQHISADRRTVAGVELEIERSETR